MRPSRKHLLALAAALVVAISAGVGFLEYRNGYVTGYRAPGAPLVRSPSLALDLKQLIGLQRFYSQLGQDKWIIGKVFPGVRDGYFIDVGAWDALEHSNSKALEDLGWNGICIDPFPRNWRNRRCQLFREVVYNRKGEKVQFRMAGPLGGIDEHIELWREFTRGRQLVELTTTTLADIVERANAPEYIHYVSIDVEGAELEVLQGFPFSRYTVGAFTIEHNLDEARRGQIRRLLEQQGYRIAREQHVDDWYVLDREPPG
jgi:FkbM family methyltransferase